MCERKREERVLIADRTRRPPQDQRSSSGCGCCRREPHATPPPRKKKEPQTPFGVAPRRKPCQQSPPPGMYVRATYTEFLARAMLALFLDLPCVAPTAILECADTAPPALVQVLRAVCVRRSVLDTAARWIDAKAPLSIRACERNPYEFIVPNRPSASA